MRKVYRGRDIEVSFDLDICIHIGECLRGQRRVFDLNRRPWALPDMAGADEVAEVVRRCPSGALPYKRLDGGLQEDPAGPTTVTPIRNGPLLVAGKIEVRHADGTIETPASRHPLPLRRIAAQAVLRQPTPGRRLPRARGFLFESV